MLSWVPKSIVDTTYYFDFSNKNISEKPALQAAFSTIDYITKTYPDPYTLYLSGGVDSQAMLYAWIKSGVKFKTFSARYHNNFNDYDLIALKTFADIHKIDINFYDFDLINFLENEHDSYANKYICGSPQITTFIKLSELTTNGTVIFSGNYIDKKFKIGFPCSNNMGFYHYVGQTRRNLIPWFFLETEELAHGFKENEYTTNFLKENNLYYGNYFYKIAMYQSNGFFVLPQTQKLNGFEKIKNYYDNNSPRLPSAQDKLMRNSNQISNRNFDLLYRNKYEMKFSNYKYSYKV